MRSRCGAATGGGEARVRVQKRWLEAGNGGRATVDTGFLRSRALVSVWYCA